MVKLTKRKGFNFFRSYYDVYNELSDKDKVLFMDALLDRQFLGVKPEGLKGMSKFAYISQTNSIDSQVKGFEDKTGIKLQPPTEPPCEGVNLPPTEQVEVEVKEEVKEEVQHVINFDKLLDFINLQTKRNFKLINNTIKNKYKARLKEGYTNESIKTAIINAVNSDYHKETNFKYLTPEFFSRNTTIDKYSEITNINFKKQESNGNTKSRRQKFVESYQG